MPVMANCAVKNWLANCFPSALARLVLEVVSKPPPRIDIVADLPQETHPASSGTQMVGKGGGTCIEPTHASISGYRHEERRWAGENDTNAPPTCLRGPWAHAVGEREKRCRRQHRVGDPYLRGPALRIVETYCGGVMEGMIRRSVIGGD